MELGKPVSLDVKGRGGNGCLHDWKIVMRGTINVGVRVASSGDEAAWPEIGDVSSGIWLEYGLGKT